MIFLMKSSTGEVKIVKLKENDMKILSWKFRTLVLFCLQKLPKKVALLIQKHLLVLVKAMQTLHFAPSINLNFTLCFPALLTYILKPLHKGLLQKFSETVSPLLQPTVVVMWLQKENKPIYLTVHIKDVLSNLFHITFPLSYSVHVQDDWVFLFSCKVFPTNNFFQTCFTLHFYYHTKYFIFALDIYHHSLLCATKV